MAERLVYTLAEAAELLGVHRRTVQRLLARQELPWLYVGTRRRIPRRALETWVDAQTRAIETGLAYFPRRRGSAP